MDGDRDFNQSNVIFWIITLGVLVAAGILLSAFVPAILWATVLSVLLFPLFKRFCKRTSRNVSALLTTILAAVVIVLPFGVFGTVLGVQAYTHIGDFIVEAKDGEQTLTVDHLAIEADKRIAPILHQLGLTEFSALEYIRENRDDIGRRLTGPVTQGATKLLMTVVTLIVALLTMFFMLRDGRRLLQPAVEIVPLPREETIAILERMAATIRSVFVGIVLVGMIQGLLAGVLYFSFGVKGALVWMAVTMFFCMIPLMGAPLVYVPLSLLLILQGSLGKGLALLGLGFLVISQIDNVLRPFFISAGTKLHPMAVFFSLLGGVLAMGPIGIMAGPMLLTLLLGLIDVLRARRRLYDASVAPA